MGENNYCNAQGLWPRIILFVHLRWKLVVDSETVPACTSQATSMQYRLLNPCLYVVSSDAWRIFQDNHSIKLVRGSVSKYCKQATLVQRSMDRPVRDYRYRIHLSGHPGLAAREVFMPCGLSLSWISHIFFYLKTRRKWTDISQQCAKHVVFPAVDHDWTI